MPKVLRIINRFNLGGPTYNAAYLTKYMTPDYETLLVGGMHDESEGSSKFILDNLDIEPILIPEKKRELNLKEVEHIFVENLFRSWNLLSFFSCQ